MSVHRSRTTDHHEGVLCLRVLDVDVGIRCAAADVRAPLATHYARMRRRLDTVDLTYSVARPNGRFVLAGNGARPLTATDAGELLLVLDQELMIRLQTLRADLYFIHAGVLDCAGKAFMLVAPSGGGKSTTVWGLVHHGFRYLSDELGPIDLRTMTIHPYPRALTLKSRPPGSYPLPRGTLATSRGFHIAPDTMPGGIRADAAPLAAVFFLRHVADAPEPAVTSISPAEAVARLYANVLNALAHPEEGLDGAVRIVRQTACFELITADLAATCALVEATVTGLAWG
jgi:hypothetical protein